MRVVNKFLCKVTNSLNFIEFVELIDEISFFSLSLQQLFDDASNFTLPAQSRIFKF